MYTKIPKEWRGDFDVNVTLEELNNVLVDLHIPTIVLIVILMVIGVFGNILVLYVYTRKYHPSTHRCFILSLAWIDMIACAVGMPLLIVSMLYPYMFPSEIGCKIFRCLHVFLVVASAFVVSAIAIERHRRILYPFSGELSLRKIKMMCGVATLLGFIVAIPAILVYGDSPVETGVMNITGTECFIDPKYSDTFFPRGYYVFQLLLTIICILMLGIFYFRIGRQILWHQKFMRENTYTQPAKPSRTVRDSNSGDKSPSDSQRSPTGSQNCVFKNPAIDHDNDSMIEGQTGDKKKLQNGSRSSTPNRKLTEPIDDIKPKLDPYGNLLKKAVRITILRSRSATPVPASKTDPKQEPRSRMDSNKSDASSHPGPSVRTRKVTMMLFIITIVFILSFIPHLVIIIWITVRPTVIDDLDPTSIAVYNVFLRSFVINNMANPIIYGFVDKKFRAECSDLAISIVYCGRR